MPGPRSVSIQFTGEASGLQGTLQQLQSSLREAAAGMVSAFQESSTAIRNSNQEVVSVARTAASELLQIARQEGQDKVEAVRQANQSSLKEATDGVQQRMLAMRQEMELDRATDDKWNLEKKFAWQERILIQNQAERDMLTELRQDNAARLQDVQQAAQEEVTISRESGRQIVEGTRAAMQERLAAEKIALEEGIQAEQVAAQEEANILIRRAGNWTKLKEAVGGLREIMGGIGIAALLAEGASVKAFSGFEDQMNRSRALAGLTTAQMHDLGSQLLEMAPQMARTPEALADGLYYIVSAGVAASQSMDVLTASTKAAAAENGNLTTVADGLTSVLAAFHLNASEAEHVTDMMTVAVREGKLEFDNLAGSVGRVSPIAKAAGISIAEMMGTITMLTRAGLSADEAATSLRATLQNLEKPAVQTKKALAEVGYSADSMRQAIKENGLIAVLQDLNEKTQGNLDLMGHLIPNVRGLVGVLSLAGQGWQEYRDVVDRVTNSQGATQRAFNDTTETVRFKMDQLKSTVLVIATMFGEQLAPKLKDAADAMSGIGTRITEFLTHNPEWAKSATEITLVVGALFTLAGGLQALMAIVNIFGMSFGQAFIGLRTTNAVLTGLLGPLGLVASAFLGLELAAKTNIPVISDLSKAILNMPSPLKIAGLELLALFAVVKSGMTIFQGIAGMITTVVIPAIQDFMAVGILGVVNGWVLALAAIGIALVAVDRALAAFTGRSLIQRVLGQDPAADAAAAGKLKDELLQLNGALNELNRGQAIGVFTELEAGMRRTVDVTVEADRGIKTLMAGVASFAPIYRDGGRAVKQLNDIVDQGTPMLGAATEAFKKMTAASEFGPYVLMASALTDVNTAIKAFTDKKADVPEALINYKNAIVDNMKAAAAARDAASASMQKSDREDAASLMSVARSAGDSAGIMKKAYADAAQAVDQEMTALTKHIADQHKTIKELAKGSSAEEQAFGVVMALNTALTDPYSKGLLDLTKQHAGLGLQVSAQVDMAYNAAKAMGIQVGAASTLEEKVKALSVADDKGVTIADKVTQAYGNVNDVYGKVASSSDALTPRFQAQMETLRLAGDHLTADSRRSIELALAQDNLTIAAGNASGAVDDNTGSLTKNSDAAIKAALALSDAVLVLDRAKNDYITGRISLEQYHGVQTAVSQAVHDGTTKYKEYDDTLKDVTTSLKNNGTAQGVTAAAIQETAKVADTVATAMPAIGKVAGEGWGSGTNQGVEDKKQGVELVMGSYGSNVDLSAGGAHAGATWAAAARAAVVGAIADILGSLIPGGKTIGIALTAGMKMGADAGSGDSKAAGSKVSADAIGAARDTAGVASPSTEFIEIAHQMIQGIIVGFDKDKADMISSVVSTFGQLIDAVQKTIEVIPKLMDTAIGPDTVDAFQHMAELIHEAIGRVFTETSSFNHIGVEHVGQVAEVASQTFSAFSSVIDFLVKLADLRHGIPDDLIDRLQQLAEIVHEAIGRVFTESSTFDAVGLAAAGEIGEVASKVFDAVGAVIEAVQKLRDTFNTAALNDTDITNMSDTIGLMLRAVGQMIDNTTKEFATAAARAGDVSESASKVFDAVSKVIDAVVKIREMAKKGGLGTDDEEQVFLSLTVAVNALNNMLDNPGFDGLIDHVSNISAVADSIAGVFDAVSKVVAAIVGIRDMAKKGGIGTGDEEQVFISLIVAMNALDALVNNPSFLGLIDQAKNISAVAAAASSVFDALSKVIGMIVAIRDILKDGGIGTPDEEQVFLSIIVSFNALNRVMESPNLQRFADNAAIISSFADASSKVFDSLTKVIGFVTAWRDGLKGKGLGSPDDMQAYYAIIVSFNALNTFIEQMIASGITEETATKAGTIADNVGKIFGALKAVADVLTALRTTINIGLARTEVEAMVRFGIEIANAFMAQMPELTKAQSDIANRVIPIVTGVFGAIKSVFDVMMEFATTVTSTSKTNSEYQRQAAGETAGYTQKSGNEWSTTFTNFDLAARLEAQLPAVQSMIEKSVGIAAKILDMWKVAFQKFEDDGHEKAYAMAENVKNVIGALKDAIGLFKDLGTVAGGDKDAINLALQQTMQDLNQQEIDAKQTADDAIKNAYQQYANSMYQSNGVSDGTAERAVAQATEAANLTLSRKLQEIQRKRAEAGFKAQQDITKADAGGDILTTVQRGIENLKKLLGKVLDTISDLMEDFKKKMDGKQEDLDKFQDAIAKMLGNVQKIVDLVKAFGEDTDKKMTQAKKIFESLPDVINGLFTSLIEIINNQAAVSDQLDTLVTVTTRMADLAGCMTDIAGQTQRISDILDSETLKSNSLTIKADAWGSAFIQFLTKLSAVASTIESAAASTEKALLKALEAVRAALIACQNLQVAQDELNSCMGTSGAGGGSDSSGTPGSIGNGGQLWGGFEMQNPGSTISGVPNTNTTFNQASDLVSQLVQAGQAFTAQSSQGPSGGRTLQVNVTVQGAGSITQDIKREVRNVIYEMGSHLSTGTY